MSLFPIEQPSPQQIVAEASAHKPVATYSLFSGGDGSLKATHWAMNNVPNCRPAHIVTGIGVPAATEFVRDTCRREGWGEPVIIRAKEDCGQDYDQIVLQHGFPGPASHSLMYRRLKERAIEELVRRSKQHRMDKVMLLTGICHDDSARRSGYGNVVIKAKGAQLWVNQMYWAGKSWMHHYAQGLPRNPVSEVLGMSGECLCGAFAQPGELAAVHLICPRTAKRIEDLEVRVRRAGHEWGWEDKPPRQRDDQLTPDLFQPMCAGCLKEPLRNAA